MKTVADLKRDFSAIKAKKMPRTEKLPLVRGVMGGVQAIERAAMNDFNFPLEEVQKCKAFLIELDDYLRP